MVFRDVDKKALIDNAAKILSKITIIEDGIVFTEDDSIVDWTYEDFRYVPENGFIGHFVERLLDGNLQDVPKEVILENKEINVQIGIVNGTTNETTFYDYGNFIVTTAERDDVSGSISFESADYTKKFNIEYVNNVTYPCLPADILVDACTQVGIDFDSYGDTYYYIPGDNETLPAGKYAIKINNNFYEFTTRAVTKDLSCITVVVEDGLEPVVTHKIVDTENLTVTREVLSYTKTSSSTASVLNVKNTKYLKLVNNDFVIRTNQFDSSDTCRDAVKAVAKLGFTWARIGTDNKLHLDFAQKDKSSVSEYNVITTDDYYNEQNQQELYGPVNCVSLGYSQVEGDDISRVISSYTEGDKIYEIKVDDNPLWYTDELKVIALHDCDRLFGIEYAVFSTETVGHPWLEGDDLVRLDNLTGDTLYTYPFDRSITYSGFIKGVISSTANSYVQDQLNYDGDVAKNIRKTLFLVDKANQRVEILAQTVEGYDEKIAKIELDNQNISLTVTNVEKGLTNTNNTVSSLQKDVDSVEGSLAGIQDEIDGVSADFEDFKDNEYLQSIDNLQKQIDGAIQFWNGPTIPTLNNYPANQWTTENDRINHQADIYTVIEDVDGELKQGKGYRFDKVNGTWKWIELTDNELSAVQALADEALKKANANAGEITALKKTTTDLSVKDGEITASVNELNTKFETEVVIAKEASGNPIIVEDAGPYPLQSIHIDGKSYQETKSGANLLSKISGVSGATDNKDGTYSQTITGLTTIHWLITDNPITIPNGKDFYLSFDAKASTNQTKGINTIYCNDGTSNINGTAVTNPNLGVNYQRYVFKINALDIEKTLTRISTQQSTLDGATITYKDLMVSFNNVAYEQYGVSPSPDFPSEIKNVEGVINEFNINLVPNVGVITNMGDGILTLANNTNSSGYAYSETSLATLMPNAVVGETYKLMFKSTSSKQPNNIYLSGWNNYLTSGNTFVLTQQMLDSKVVFYGGYNEVSVISDFIITKNLTIDDYVPYGKWLKQHTFSNQLFDIDEVKWDTFTANSITITKENDGTLTFSNGVSGTIGGYYNASTLYNVTEPRLLKAGTVIKYYNKNLGNTAFVNACFMFYFRRKSDGVRYRALGDVQFHKEYVSATLPDDSYFAGVGLWVGDNVTFNNHKAKILLKVDDGDDTYEEYNHNSSLINLNKDDLFDGVLVEGNIDDTGVINPANSYRLASESYIPVEPNTTYTITNDKYTIGVVIVSYDANKEFISRKGYANGFKTQYFTTDSNTSYVRFCNSGLSDNPTNDKTVIYKIYKGVDDGDYYSIKEQDVFENGKYVQNRRTITLNGSENWVWWGAAGYSGSDLDTNAIYLAKSFFDVAQPDVSTTIVNGVHHAKGLSNQFPYIRNTVWGDNKNMIAINASNDMCLQIRLKDSITGITSDKTNAEKLALFKQWLSENPVELEYQLLTPLDFDIAYSTLELKEGYNHITLNDDIEPNMDITYLTNSKLNALYITKSELKVTTDSISTQVSSVTDLTTELGNDIVDINNSLSNYATGDRVDTLEQSVTTLQTDRDYTITAVNDLKENGVSKVKTETGFVFDSEGLHIKNSKSPVGSTLDNRKLLIEDNTSSTPEELLYAGVDDTSNEAVVRTKNLTVHQYFTIGSVSRFEPFEDDEYEDAVGVFEI